MLQKAENEGASIQYINASSHLYTKFLSTYYEIIFLIAILNFSRLRTSLCEIKAGKNLQKGENLLSSLNLKFYISFPHF